MLVAYHVKLIDYENNRNRIFKIIKMEANELRIGNYVYFFKEKHEVIGIHFLNRIIELWRFGIVKQVNIKDIEIIPITEEWLLKFGFKKAEGSDCDYKLQIQKDNKLGNTDFDIWIDFGEEGVLSDFPIIQIVSQNSEWLRTDIKYIHQLQNLYFSLKGYELTLS